MFLFFLVLSCSFLFFLVLILILFLLFRMTLYFIIFRILLLLLLTQDEIRGVMDEYTTKFSDIVKENQQLRKENHLLKNVY